MKAMVTIVVWEDGMAPDSRARRETFTHGLTGPGANVQLVELMAYEARRLAKKLLIEPVEEPAFDFADDAA